jgi:hypothetical protein
MYEVLRHTWFRDAPRDGGPESPIVKISPLWGEMRMDRRGRHRAPSTSPPRADGFGSCRRGQEPRPGGPETSRGGDPGGGRLAARRQGAAEGAGVSRRVRGAGGVVGSRLGPDRGAAGPAWHKEAGGKVTVPRRASLDAVSPPTRSLRAASAHNASLLCTGVLRISCCRVGVFGHRGDSGAFLQQKRGATWQFSAFLGPKVTQECATWRIHRRSGISHRAHSRL